MRGHLTPAARLNILIMVVLGLIIVGAAALLMAGTPVADVG